MSSRRYRKRRVKWRSHRQVRQVLLAFGVVGAVLGLLLLAYFGILRRQLRLAALGGVYLAGACLLMGVRGVLGHLDELRRHSRPRDSVLPSAREEAS